MAFLVVVGVAVVNLVLGGVVGAFLVDYKSAVSAHASTDADNLSKTLDAYFQGTISQMDLADETVADEYRRELNAGGVDLAQFQAILEWRRRGCPN